MDCTSCPICLQDVEPSDVALLQSCGHSYCVYCIVKWAEDKFDVSCPQCKKKFDSILTFRNLDGSIHQMMMKESISLLKRTHWFRQHKFAATCDPGRAEDEEWEEEYYEQNEIDDTEDFYFSNAAGSARIVFSNRKFGKNGFIRSGRVFAQSTSASAGNDQEEQAKKNENESKTPKERKTNPKGQKAKRREDKKKQDTNRIV